MGVRESQTPKNHDGLLVATWLRVRLSPRYLQTDICRFNPGDDRSVSVTQLSAPQQGPQDWLTRVWWWWFEFHSGTLPWWLDYSSVVQHLCYAVSEDGIPIAACSWYIFDSQSYLRNIADSQMFCRTPKFSNFGLLKNQALNLPLLGPYFPAVFFKANSVFQNGYFRFYTIFQVISVFFGFK